MIKKGKKLTNRKKMLNYAKLKKIKKKRINGTTKKQNRKKKTQKSLFN